MGEWTKAAEVGLFVLVVTGASIFIFGSSAAQPARGGLHGLYQAERRDRRRAPFARDDGRHRGRHHQWIRLDQGWPASTHMIRRDVPLF